MKTAYNGLESSTIPVVVSPGTLVTGDSERFNRVMAHAYNVMNATNSTATATPGAHRAEVRGSEGQKTWRDPL